MFNLVIELNDVLRIKEISFGVIAHQYFGYENVHILTYLKGD